MTEVRVHLILPVFHFKNTSDQNMPNMRSLSKCHPEHQQQIA